MTQKKAKKLSKQERFAKLESLFAEATEMKVELIKAQSECFEEKVTELDKELKAINLHIMSLL